MTTDRHHALSLPVAAALVVLLASLALAAPVGANTLYEFESSELKIAVGEYARTDRITGSFILSGAFVGIETNGAQDVLSGVLDYRFTDGHQTLTPANSVARDFAYSWNVLMNPITSGGALDWRIDLAAGPASGIFAWGIEGGGEFLNLAFLNGTPPNVYWPSTPDAPVGGTNGASICAGAVDCQGGLLQHSTTWTAVETTATQVPEPSTLALLGVGLGAVALRRLRRRSRQHGARPT